MFYCAGLYFVNSWIISDYAFDKNISLSDGGAVGSLWR